MALIAQLGEHCTGIAEVVGSNPHSEPEFFSGLCSSSVTAALALMTVPFQSSVFPLASRLFGSLNIFTE